MMNSVSQAWRRRVLATALGLVLAACGGGGDGVGSGGTGTFASGSFSSGTITGFGSIIVNGVRYDESAAQIVDASGQPGSTADLRLGMVVEIEASGIRTDPATGRRTASASRIRHGSEIEGPVEVVDPSTGQLLVLGQTVVVDGSTVFDDDLRGGVAVLQPGDVLEINGFFTGDGRYQATRVEREDDADDGYELRGPVTAVDAGTRTLVIGAATIDLGNLASAPTVAAGDFVRVDLATTRNGAGHWVATRLSRAATGGDGGGNGGNGGNSHGGNGERPDRSEAEVEGYITAFESTTRFSVNGVPVDAGSVAALPPGLAAGVRVEVEGRIEAGLLIARTVEREDDDDNNDGVGDDDGIEIEGRIAGLDLAGRAFTIRSVTIAWDEMTRFEDGTAAQLREGAKVEISGTLSADGVTVRAGRIEFDD